MSNEKKPELKHVLDGLEAGGAVISASPEETSNRVWIEYDCNSYRFCDWQLLEFAEAIVERAKKCGYTTKETPCEP